LWQIIAAPYFAFCFFFGMGILENKRISECWTEFIRKFPYVYMVTASKELSLPNISTTKCVSYFSVWLAYMASKSILQLCIRSTTFQGHLRKLCNIDMGRLSIFHETFCRRRMKKRAWIKGFYLLICFFKWVQF